MSPIKIAIPGSKSLSNRALILAALSNGRTTIKNTAICDDTNHLIANLKKLGVKVTQKNTTLKITGVCKNGQLNFPKSQKTINLYTGNAGTTTRFLAALAPITGNEIIIDGDARMRERPIDELVKALNQLGAKIAGKNGCPPLHISSKILVGGIVNLPGNISSQYLSALLMVAPFAKKKITINITTKLCSKPYIAMTMEVMKEFGFKVQNKNFKKFVVQPQIRHIIQKKSEIFTVESDTSSASYFGAYAALHPKKKILLQNIRKNSLQGDIKFLEYLRKMGCKISENKTGTIIQGPKNLKSLGTIDMNETPDLVMTFAVLALFTKGKTQITNIGNLRIKETNRLQALENEIKKLAKALNAEKSIIVKTGKNWIEIQRLVKNNRSKSVHMNKAESEFRISQAGLDIHTYNDHRIAMAFGILTDLIPNLKIENPDCVSKSYPNFWQDLKKISHGTANLHRSLRCTYPVRGTRLHKNDKTKAQHVNIVLTGLRGSGKSTIGKILKEKISQFSRKKWDFVDIDEEIEKEEKAKISDIVSMHGWKYFRAVERRVTKKVAKLKNTVISTGGGTIIDRENEKALKKNGQIIYLYIKPHIAAARILTSKNRPPLTNKKSIEEEMKHLYKERNVRYCESANIIFECSENIDKDCTEIIRILNN